MALTDLPLKAFLAEELIPADTDAAFSKTMRLQDLMLVASMRKWSQHSARRSRSRDGFRRARDDAVFAEIIRDGISLDCKLRAP
ncbi:MULTISPECIES: hypothetical protein [Bradyrhizobium]|uniref:hypothetical protein n=1 Tax=Bradyrhizobium TaxID=374 RepID=UPI0008412A95|nr:MULTISPECIES: hypothetical protein [Bradyrhizobium]MCP1838231.1 hypothetical protein [Bradyrhizobium sp. USDA 4538]MCP1898794.1 hypothetical protein [Bradyrhizobium sp. USDA 4537]MCP1909294.1 hypothetical protein [Bradyrhizobium elkanii]MCP1987094.1 hypothetical protein [Bradyrhizobium sp. USDA 4539]ODM72127.1 hypothetical protein A6452_41555 [Bradyrhizobium elkanii]